MVLNLSVQVTCCKSKCKCPNSTATVYCLDKLLVMLVQQALNHLYTSQGNIEGKAKWNSLFSMRPVIKCFVMPPNLKNITNCKKITWLMSSGTQICSGFKVHKLIMCKSKSSGCFPRELVWFVHLKESGSFDL